MPRQRKRIQAVLFDLDDTLIDWSGRTKSWEKLSRQNIGNIHHCLEAAGYTLPDADTFHRRYSEIVQQSWDRANKTWESVCFATVLSDTFEAIGLDANRIDLDEVMRAYGWGPAPGVIPYEDAIPVLDHLRQRDYKIGLITNAMLPMWMRDIELQHYQLLDYFDVRLTSGDVGYIKPHPAIYHRALEPLAVVPERAVFIGDRPENDVAGANNAGLVSVWMDPPHLSNELNDVKPNYTITHLRELLPILEQLD
ncbi:MAG: HAD family hydrolase [Chloroflexi bacterium]|nr:HAD family hydrolase [Chloroflexota bacterium]